MEVTGSTSIRIPLDEPSRTAEARRIARQMAVRIGFDEKRAEQVALVVTEACTNLLKHAGTGEILLHATGQGSSELRGLEVLALDRGPGMDLDRCLEDGYSTGSSSGQGLGAIRRLSTACDFYSLKHKGTVLVARWSATLDPSPVRAQNGVRVGGVNVPKPGQEVCGDSWSVERSSDRWVVMVADGLGHGYDANVASGEAVKVLHRYPDLSPKELLERCHLALRSTRGAAVAVARVDPARSLVTFAGVGNIGAQIYSSSRASTQRLVSMNGTSGAHSSRIQEFSYVWPDDALLVVYTDGLTTSASVEAYPRLPTRDPSLIAGVLYRDFGRGHDDATVVVAKAA